MLIAYAHTGDTLYDRHRRQQPLRYWLTDGAWKAPETGDLLFEALSGALTDVPAYPAAVQYFCESL